MNRVQLIGNTTADPEVHYIGDDKKAAFTLAVNGYGDKTDFFIVTAWKNTADIIDRYVHKGDKLGVSGRLSSRKFEDSDGHRRTIVEVVAEDVDLLTKRADREEKNTKPDNDRRMTRTDDEGLPF